MVKSKLQKNLDMIKNEKAKSWNIFDEKIIDLEFLNVTANVISQDFMFLVNNKRLCLSFSGLMPYYSVMDENLFSETLNYRTGLNGYGFYEIHNSNLIEWYRKQSQGVFEHGGYALPIHLSVVTSDEIIDVIFPELPEVTVLLD